MKKIYILLISCVLVLTLTVPAIAQGDDDIARKARKLHFSAIVLDTHCDTTPRLQRRDWKFTEEHTEGHIDLPRMKKGGLNAMFFSIFMSGNSTGPKAVNDSIERIAAVYKLAEDLPDSIAVCVTADQVRQAHRRRPCRPGIGLRRRFDARGDGRRYAFAKDHGSTAAQGLQRTGHQEDPW